MFFREPTMPNAASVFLLPNSSSRQLLVTSGFPNTANPDYTDNNGFAFGKERHRYVVTDMKLLN